MNQIIPYLIKAKALPGSKLWIEFEDGVTGEVDLNKWKRKKIFTFWNDEKNFSSFEITADKKIKWNDVIEMDPDAFYLQLINKTFEEYASDQQFLRHHN